MPGLRGGQPRNRSSIRVIVEIFLFLCFRQTSYGAQPSLWHFPLRLSGRNVKLTTDIRLV